MYNKQPVVSNRLFATFFPQENLDVIMENIISKYDILYNKIFILDIKESNEKIATYNSDSNNVSSLMENTILVHRKKISNTLYSLNSLNLLIKKLNNGVMDDKFIINWEDYKNCLLLTKNGELKQLDTRLFKIVNIN